jgi:hypothetical protein
MQQELPGMPIPQAPKPKKAAPSERPQWSGPIPGQTVMHPRRLGELSHGVDADDYAMGITRPETRHMEVDRHGFVQQVHDVSQQFAGLDIDRNTQGLYGSHGGSEASRASVREHWVNQPRTEIRTDTPLHTTQSTYDTAGMGDLHGIVRDLEAGGKINKPAWVVKDKGKMFVLDGHHRITAARMAGLSHFPARVWDRDAETGWKP